MVVAQRVRGPEGRWNLPLSTSTLCCATVEMMKLELDLHGLREETSAHLERKEKETMILQHRLQELQSQFTETQKLGLKKDTVMR